VAKITSYTSVLVFGTLFLGASITMSARIKATLFQGILFDPTTLERLGAWLFPLSLSFLAFLLMYLVIPFTRVRLASALLGALFGSVLWEVGKNLFANTVGVSVRYSTIYGSLAVIPIFLIWLYITWIIVLLGLEISFVHQHFAALVRSRSTGDRDDCDRVPTALQIYTMIARRFHQGKEPPTADELSRRFLVATGSVDSHIDRLVKAGLARRVANLRDSILDRKLRAGFERLLRLVLAWRYAALAASLGIFLAICGLVAGGIVPFVLLQEIDAESITVNLEMAAGTPERRTIEVIQLVEDLAMDYPEVDTVFSVVGTSVSDRVRKRCPVASSSALNSTWL